MTGNIRVDQTILTLVKDGKEVSIIYVPRGGFNDPSEVPVDTSFVTYLVEEGVWRYLFKKEGDQSWDEVGYFSLDSYLDMYRCEGNVEIVKSFEQIKEQIDLAA